MRFYPNLVYPSDSMGEYQEVQGPIVEVGERLSNSFPVTIEINGERVKAYASLPFENVAKTATWARIRVYDCGGGWYPDSVVTAMGSVPIEPPTKPRRRTLPERFYHFFFAR